MASAVSPSTSGPGTLGRSFVGGWDGGALNGAFGGLCVSFCNGAGMCCLCSSCGGVMKRRALALKRRASDTKGWEW